MFRLATIAQHDWSWPAVLETLPLMQGATWPAVREQQLNGKEVAGVPDRYSGVGCWRSAGVKNPANYLADSL